MPVRISVPDWLSLWGGPPPTDELMDNFERGLRDAECLCDPVFPRSWLYHLAPCSGRQHWPKIIPKRTPAMVALIGRLINVRRRPLGAPFRGTSVDSTKYEQGKRRVEFKEFSKLTL